MKKFTVGAFFALILVSSLNAQVTIIPFNSAWKYLDNGTDQGAAWRSGSFNDASWNTGSGKFGYGISEANTIISFGPDSKNKYVTTYFRKTISILNPGVSTLYEASIKRDDGAVVYVNGTEVYRSNMPAGAIGYSTLASTSATDNGNTEQVFTINSSLFVAGDNTIAIEIHQQKINAGEKDMVFDFSLKTPAPVAPTLSPVTITSNNITPSLAKVGDIVSLGFTASEPISTPTVTIATHAVTATAGSGNSYTATYTMISGDASGVVPFTINFSSTTGTPGTPVTATTNGSSVTFDKILPTVVSINRQNPSSETTNSQTVTYRSTFSESVNGVGAADFSLITTSGTVSGTVSSVTPVSGTTYDVTVNFIDGNGVIRLDLNASGTGITDAAGNAISGGFTTGQTYTINQSAPTLSPVTITSNNVTPSLAKVGDIVSLSFTASEPISTPAVTIATHAVTATAGSGNSYTATYTMISGDASGVVPFTINFSSTTGTPGTPVTATTNGSSVTFDKTLPTVVSINRQNPSSETTNSQTVTYRSTFSESVNGVGAADFSLISTSGTVSGTVSSVTPVSGTTYDVTVNFIDGNGVIRLDLNASGTGITDAAGNAISGGFTTGQTYTINQSAPTLSLVTITSNNVTPSLAKVGDIVSLSFTASEPISTPTVTIATHAVTATAGSGNSYTATYTMISGDASGVVPFTINFSSTTGTPGTPVTATTNGSSVTFDKTLPTVVSINRQNPSSETTNSQTVTYRSTFSESVNGVGAADFSLITTSGTVSGMVSSITPVSGTTYDVTVNFIDGNGVIRLDLNASGTGITDAAGNAISGGFTAGQTYTINQSAPTLSLVTITSNNVTPSLAKVGDIVSLSFTASEPISTPTVTIATHAVTATAGSGNSYTATYTMISGDASGVVPFTINFSSTTGTPGTPVTATTNGSSVTFDKTLPTVVSINRQNPSSETTNSQTVTYRSTFSESVNGVGAADFSLITTSGTVSGMVSSVTPVSGTTYDVTVNFIDGNGVIRLDLNASGTGITDAAGNAISGGFTTGQTYTINQTVTQPGFVSVVPLTPVNVVNQTKDKPQAKAWYYANQWWCCLSAVGGTKIYRLDGTSWTEILLLNTTGSKPDCWVTGDLVHLLLYKGSGSLLYSVQYDMATNTYKLWSQRPTFLRIDFPSGSETATLLVDGNGRMWAATAGTTNVNVWWSDAPYTAWSAPITIATGINDDDICALTPIPGQNKIGILWSNQTTKRYGFRTHTNGASPDSWSADEVPASQSALNVGKGMADDHISIVAASDGTLYAAVKTGYDNSSYPELLLLVRRPAGTWDNAYTVTNDGTQAIVVLNEVQGKVKVVYTTVTGGGGIVYRESSTSNISFGSTMPLMSGTNFLLNYASSTHQAYNPDVVIMATDETSSPWRAISVLASDASSSTPLIVTRDAVKSQKLVQENLETILKAYPNPFNSSTNLTFRLKKSGHYTIEVFDSKGSELYTLDKGWAEAGQDNIRKFNNASSLPGGLYIVTLKTSDNISTIKLLKN